MGVRRFIVPISGIVACVFLPLMAHAAFDSADSAQEKRLSIIRVTPDGEDVPAGKQLVIQFNRPVVPIGKMERSAAEIPVIITPALACEWRWINTSALACNLPDKTPLLESTHYTVDIKPGIQTEDGVTIAETYHHQFITERPSISYKEFNQWKSPSFPILRLVFNQPVDKESVAKHVFFTVGTDNHRARLKVRPDPEDHTPPQFIPVPGESYALLFKKLPAKKSDDDLHASGGKEARRVWLVEPTRELPLDTHVVLKAEPGLISAIGPERSVTTDEIVQFETYPKFKFLGVLCTTNENAPLKIPAGETVAGKCNPQQPIELSFSAPVNRDKMGKMVKFNPPIGGWKASSDEDSDAPEAEESEGSGRIGWEYQRPHEKNKTYEVWLPAGLKPAQIYTAQSYAQTLSM